MLPGRDVMPNLRQTSREVETVHLESERFVQMGGLIEFLGKNSRQRFFTLLPLLFQRRPSEMVDGKHEHSTPGDFVLAEERLA